MTTFIIISLVLLALAMVFIWRHFLRSSLKDRVQNYRGQTNKDLYHEHLAEIQLDLDKGRIDLESFDYLKSELDRSLLADMQATEKEQQSRDKQTSKLWPVLISVFVIGFSGLGYYQFGAWPQAMNPVAVAEHGAGSQADVIINRLKALHEEVKANPENTDAWFQLGQILTTVGQYESAFIAYQKVIDVEGEQADILALQAQVKYYQNNQQRNPEINALIDKAKALDPEDASTLMFIGMDHYVNGRFKQAAVNWQKIIDSGRAGVNTDALQEAIDEALAAAETAPTDSAVAGNSGSAAGDASGVADGPSFTLDVSMSDDIINAMADKDDKNIFVYAVNSQGPRIPLAAVKIKASDLPMTLILDDSKAMNPQMQLSSAEQVTIYAVLSMQGTPGMNPGDFKGEIANINVEGQQQMNLIIDSVVK
ncbi:c-type cytochrome biogenesis protein CcmI [Thalassotalea sp. PS06]|uniref:c-type cytochrome biogenesis protein CcmI n=1 Tax=Thalassotalea sp. PS06 TaxID=2594005 RepID=UPI0011652EF4|nr:c-type cytochrome biogenesis protein CcmI [Thalassotalea sp. PS06]QDP00577.1 c-type cytochrome biogenesis protein CcmI [Thalassotalea sp. PS06]